MCVMLWGCTEAQGAGTRVSSVCTGRAEAGLVERVWSQLVSGMSQLCCHLPGPLQPHAGSPRGGHLPRHRLSGPCLAGTQILTDKQLCNKQHNHFGLLTYLPAKEINREKQES